MCTCGLGCRSAFSIKSLIFHEIVAYQELFCVACSRLSDSRMTHKCKARENVSAWPTILVTNRWNGSHLSWIFSKFLTFTLHTFVLTQMCQLSFPNVEPSVFWSNEMTADPNQHWGAENHKSVSRFVTRIVVSSRLIFVFVLSQLRGPDYLGAWNMKAMFCVVTLLVINLSNHENDNWNEKIKTNNKSNKKKKNS